MIPKNYDKPIYDTFDAMDTIKRKYPLIPIWIIRRVLFANDLYQKKIGIVDWDVTLDDWYYRKPKKRKKRK